MIDFNVIIDNDERLGKHFKTAVEKTDFKQVLKFFRVVASDLDDEEKTEKIIGLFFESSVPRDAWREILLFIEPGTEFDDDGTPVEGSGGAKYFDWNVDAGRVFAAFWQVYGIDLRSASFHWWTFRELFEGLPTGTKLADVVDIRTREVKSTDSPEYRKTIRRLQDKYSLQDDDGSRLNRVLDAWG